MALIEQELAGPLPTDPRELLARLLDAHVWWRREQPGFQRLWYGGAPLTTLRDRDEENDRQLATVLHEVMVRQYGFADTPRSFLHTRLAVKLAGHLLNSAFQERRDGDPDILAEALLLLDRWYLDAPPED